MRLRAGLACLALLGVVAAPPAVDAKPKVAKKKKQKAKVVRWKASSAAVRFTGPGILSGGFTGEGPTAPKPGPGGPAPPDPTAPTPAPPTPIHTLSVASREYSLTLSRQVLTPGLETIQLNNRGEDPHDLVISLDDGVNAPIATYPETPSLESHTEKVDLPAGRYKLFCSLPGHEALGMRATLRVE
jgi:plastocyanin